jgi:hypothetical protein
LTAGKDELAKVLVLGEENPVLSAGSQGNVFVRQARGDL